MMGREKSATSAKLPVLAGVVRERVYSGRRKLATVAVAGLAVAVGYGVVFGHNGLTVYEHKRQEEKSLQQQMQQLQVENERLQGHVERLQNDPGAIEHQARVTLHYTRAGEVIVTLPMPPNTAGKVATP